MCVRRNYYSSVGAYRRKLIVLILDDLYARFLAQFQGKVVGVTFLVNYLFDTAVYYHFGADGTGLMRHVNSCVVNRNAQFGSLNNGILFGVHGVTHFLSGPRGDIEFFP